MIVEAALPALVAPPDSESLLERAYLDAVERIDDTDETRARILDAAYEQFCRMGIRRSTMDDVARRAKVSRITVYRRFATKDVLVEHVVRREFRRYFDRFLVDIEQAETAADRARRRLARQGPPGRPRTRPGRHAGPVRPPHRAR
ncbi:helix-turn-helix domain-containing protein, partial [Streptosporangium sp. NPDC048865]|uniref:TetR/AcrR family transcriptional regulator n=1 Tax=Streptosporangium sp. NPDC048865 TaxID=3155766 RepID=UPI003422B7C6